jgi:hypothetical protein
MALQGLTTLDRRRHPDRRASSRGESSDRRSGRDRRQDQRLRPSTELQDTLYLLREGPDGEPLRVSLWNASTQGLCLLSTDHAAFAVGQEYWLMEQRRLTGREVSSSRLSCLWQERDGCLYGGFRRCA